MKRDFVIVVDSCSDLSKEIRDLYYIKYVRMGIVQKLKDKDNELYASLDWDLYSNSELFNWLRNGMSIKTTQVSTSEFERVFSEILDNNKDILYIACSSALSGSFNYSLIVKDELVKKYKDSKIICIDSLNSCLGQGSMAIYAAKLKKEGKDIEEIANIIEDEKLMYNQVATVETLDYLKNAGRVKATAAFFGNLFGVKPIIISDAKGQNYAIKKVKGRKNSFVEMVNMIKETIINPKDQTIYVVHADCVDDANKLKELIEKEIKPNKVELELMGPIIGVSTGPGTIGIYYKGKKVDIIGG